ncbi:uncharacterized protein LOC116609823 isoform X2 [Nematostella vectensis]|uniref:uncharacterized protein LOC116609823 isoform X2 n=1 Tax=Nematostella vectensis TaxID=45351 RepID=UPI00138FE401|nr:uncharacterized protein LOC116609823 isoform X2 [Nematostella vectensis]
MRGLTWCIVLLVGVLLMMHSGQGVDNVDKRPQGINEDRAENATVRAIPGIHAQRRGPRHRRHHVLSRKDRRALRHRYNSVLTIGVGLGVAGGWICIATLVYVVRFMKARGVEKKQLEGEGLI